ncbi:MAG: hypothetical protein LBG58_04780, partial [Planctomycetaceae bacterium]|nr:hypothetical protein [Planctomycetaceae bacterium]
GRQCFAETLRRRTRRLAPVDGWKVKTNSIQHNNKPTGATFRRKVAYLLNQTKTTNIMPFAVYSLDWKFYIL